jgi:hypothetical protein
MTTEFSIGFDDDDDDYELDEMQAHVIIEHLRAENNMLFDMAARRLAELKEAQARIAELEAKLAASKPGERKTETGVRAGLLKGRIRMKGVHEPSMVRPTFDAALQMATTDDLMWALKLLIEHPKAKRTWRDHRIRQIDKRLREIMAAAQACPIGKAQP